MALRPLAFGIRFRDRDRTLRVRMNDGSARSYLVEETRRGRPALRRSHGSLTSALRDFAASWRARLH
jgi:hypothetical protein